MHLQHNYDLTKLNTLQLKSSAAYFITLNTLSELSEIATNIHNKHYEYFVLGGGSNIILPEQYVGMVIYNQLKGVELINATDEYVDVQVMAGENWDNFVAYSLSRKWYGLENLSLIPGTAGAAPIQNIGAYGVEAKDFIYSVEVYDVASQKIYVIPKAECDFRYRNSRFKQEHNLIVVAVNFRLSTIPQLNIKYGDVSKHLSIINNPTALDLRNCIIKIRQDKLPDPRIIANVGSFFHNPIVTNLEAQTLQEQYPGMPVYPVDDLHAKISAGWLIDNLGLKGHTAGNVGVYDKQALVLVNNGGATKSELLHFAGLIQTQVFDKYHIKLNIEPIIL